MTITEWTESEWQQEIEDDMKTQHTPGPWHVSPDWPFSDEHGRKHDAIVIRQSNGAEHLICSFEHSVMRGAQNANARLIAAAPELLDALELAQTTIQRLHRHAPGSANGTLDVIQKALELATRQ